MCIFCPSVFIFKVAFCINVQTTGALQEILPHWQRHTAKYFQLVMEMALVKPSVLLLFCMLQFITFYSGQAPHSLCNFDDYINFKKKEKVSSVPWWHEYKVMQDQSHPPKWHQANMVSQFTRYLIIRGIICGLYKPSVRSNCGRICSPLAYSSTRIWLQSHMIREKCQRPSCNKSHWVSRSRMPPCGAISFSSDGTESARWKLMLPSYLEFNFTIWRVVSRKYPLAHSARCKYVPSLELWELHSYASNRIFLRSRFCAYTTVQHVVSTASTVAVMWRNSIPYEESASFCLSYEPIAFNYARQYAESYWTSKLKYFKDEIIHQRFIIKTQAFDDGKIFTSYKYFSTHIDSSNVHYRFMTGDLLQNIWSITGSVFYIPEFTLTGFLCSESNASFTKRSTIEIYDYPFAYHEPIWQLQEYIMGDPIKCPTALPSLPYRSSIGDLTVKLALSINSDSDVVGNISYITLSCPCPYCKTAVSNISSMNWDRFSMASGKGNAQQRLLISLSHPESGFIAISNFSVWLQGATHVPCYYGGLFIYELEPLTLVAKICTRWVADSWYNAVKRVDGTNGLHFNNRPLLFILKSYGQKFSVRLSGYAAVSPCAGIVNALFRNTLKYAEVSQRGLINVHPNMSNVRHTGGCLQMVHIVTDDEYLHQNDELNLKVFAPNEGRNLVNHTVTWSMNNNIIMGRPAYLKLIDVLEEEGKSKGELHCYILGRDIDLPDGNHFVLNKSFAVSLQPGRWSYRVTFSIQCLVFGINPVVIMDDIPRPEHSCLQPEELQSHVRVFENEFYANEYSAAFPSYVCGQLQVDQNIYPKATLSFIFQKPYLTPLCCVLYLDIYLYRRHLLALDYLLIQEHSILDTFLPRRHWTLSPQRARNYARRQIKNSQYFWVFNSVHKCNISGTSQKHENVSENMRVFGRPWSVNAIHTDYIRLGVLDWECNGTDHRRADIKFRFGEWYSSSTHSPNWNAAKSANYTLQQLVFSWSDRYSYCFEPTGVCYYFYETLSSSWLDGYHFCQSKNMTLLSTPTNFEWELITSLFAAEPTMVNLVKYCSLGFLNLLHNQVC